MQKGCSWIPHECVSSDQTLVHYMSSVHKSFIQFFNTPSLQNTCIECHTPYTRIHLCGNIAVSALTIHRVNYLSSCDKMFSNSHYSLQVIVFLFRMHYFSKHFSPSQVQRIQGRAETHVLSLRNIHRTVFYNTATRWILSQNLQDLYSLWSFNLGGLPNSFFPLSFISIFHITLNMDTALYPSHFFFSAASHPKWISTSYKFPPRCSTCKLKHSYCSICHQ